MTKGECHYQPLFSPVIVGGTKNMGNPKGVLEGRSPSKQIILPFPLISPLRRLALCEGKGNKAGPQENRRFFWVLKGDRVN